MATHVMDLTRRPPRAAVSVEASLPAELLVQLIAFESPESAPTYDAGSALFDRVRTEASNGLLATLGHDADHPRSPWGNLLGLALRPPLPHDVAGFLRRIEETPPRDLWLMMAGARIPSVRKTVGDATYGAAADGDPAARDELLGSMRDNDEPWPCLPVILELRPDELRTRLLTVLGRWHEEVFASTEAETRRILERDVRAKLALKPGMTRDVFIEFATNGLELGDEWWTSRIVLVPHVSMRPWNVLAADGDTSIICYPAADQSFDEDPDAPPPRLLRLHKALGDEKRLRILKILARSPAGLPELSEAIGLAKSTTHHHMVVLRSAGLIRTTTDPEVRYTLRGDAMPEAGALLSAFLGGTP